MDHDEEEEEDQDAGISHTAAVGGEGLMAWLALAVLLCVCPLSTALLCAVLCCSCGSVAEKTRFGGLGRGRQLVFACLLACLPATQSLSQQLLPPLLLRC